ncbi:MAG: hypothetical protein HY076_01210, partial [Candidatus Eisenbacteria bacterium]|nr:hypothetical protein [Candidatus Eisenbacteria bacterium]
MPSASDRTGSPSSPLTPLEPVLDFARAWAGGDRLALIVSGSHASGEAVWAEHEGRRVSLSDLDVVAVVPDAAAKRAARERARAASDGLATRLLALGLAAPLEVGFHTPADLERMPARPATLELRRHGAVIEGDPSWLARVPTWSARDVSAEETLLLLENRGFELIGAECLRDRAGLAALQRRHAVLKTALDLAGIEALAAGEYPDGAAARVARARAHRDRDPAHEPPWDEALAWRAGVLTGDGGAAAEGELARTIAAWVGLWRRRVGDPGDPARPFAAIARVAARARARRRVREAV